MNTIYTSKGNNDECHTPKYAIFPLLEYLEPFKGKVIWCPFDTENSNFVKVLKEHGHDVIYSHINNGQDFFEYQPEHFDLIVSNPPFTNKKAYFERALSFNKPFALLMSLTWLNDAAPVEIFYNKNLQLLMFDKRIKFENQPQTKRINFKSAYYCVDLLPSKLEMRKLKEGA